MPTAVEQLSQAARFAAQQKNWIAVKAGARDILNRRRDSAEGYFLLGLAEKETSRAEAAGKALRRALDLDAERYDAAVELAELLAHGGHFGGAVDLLRRCEQQLQNSPRYLDKAATIYTDAGLPESAWPLYEAADRMQPGIDSLRARLAACSVYVGKIDLAKSIYRELLERNPAHQRNHYELSRLETAADDAQLDSIKAILKPRVADNIYAYYALGKHSEDLGRWSEAFDYYRQAGAAASSQSDYNVSDDVATIEAVIEHCTAEWLQNSSQNVDDERSEKTPIFIVGLPRSGTTLVERILSSHTDIESVGESFFMQSVIKSVSRVSTTAAMSAQMIEIAATKSVDRIRAGYLQAIAYRLGDRPQFIEKLPENFLYLGFIAKAFPDARIIHVSRHPMDNCFALFKQSFFRFAYNLDDLGEYYSAYRQLSKHWQRVLAGRIVAVSYEELVDSQERETRALLDAIGVEFQDACLHFEKNRAATNTASAAQVREKVHGRSVGLWKNVAEQLRPLSEKLQQQGITID